MADKAKIVVQPAPAGGGAVVADRDLYETMDGKIVEEGDPAANRLIAAKGQPIHRLEAERLGLVEKPAAAPAKPKAEAPAPLGADRRGEPAIKEVARHESPPKKAK